MTFPAEYKCLEKSEFYQAEFKLTPIQYSDRIAIMNWRNEQLKYLRQGTILTTDIQNRYFREVVLRNFGEISPKQILFRFVRNDRLIGYGGLVHIDWDNFNAEISFLLDTLLNQEDEHVLLGTIFFSLIQDLAKSAKLHKIYTYGYDLDAYRFAPLINNKYKLEALLAQHVKIEQEYIAVKIYSKII